MSTAISNANELTADKWYAVGFRNDDGEIEWGGAMLYKYLGNGYWVDEDGEEVKTTFDPCLQLYVSPNGADAYMVQS